jgi:hypothetical protein
VTVTLGRRPPRTSPSRVAPVRRHRWTRGRRAPVGRRLPAPDPATATEAQEQAPLLRPRGRGRIPRRVRGRWPVSRVRWPILAEPATGHGPVTGKTATAVRHGRWPITRAQASAPLRHRLPGSAPDLRVSMPRRTSARRGQGVGYPPGRVGRQRSGTDTPAARRAATARSGSASPGARDGCRPGHRGAATGDGRGSGRWCAVPTARRDGTGQPNRPRSSGRPPAQVSGRAWPQEAAVSSTASASPRAPGQTRARSWSRTARVSSSSSRSLFSVNSSSQVAARSRAS